MSLILDYNDPVFDENYEAEEEEVIEVLTELDVESNTPSKIFEGFEYRTTKITRILKEEY